MYTPYSHCCTTTADRFLAWQMLQASAALAAFWALRTLRQTAQQLEVTTMINAVLMHATAMHCALASNQQQQQHCITQLLLCMLTTTSTDHTH
jgi:hypothetical protein